VRFLHPRRKKGDEEVGKGQEEEKEKKEDEEEKGQGTGEIMCV